MNKWPRLVECSPELARQLGAIEIPDYEAANVSPRTWLSSLNVIAGSKKTFVLIDSETRRCFTWNCIDGAQNEDSGADKLVASFIGGYYFLMVALWLIGTFVFAHFIWKYW